MCGTQFRRPSAGDRITAVTLPKNKRLSITKNYVKNAPKEDADIQLDLLRSSLSTIQIHELHEESSQAQLTFQEQIVQMHIDCAERLAKINNLGGKTRESPRTAEAKFLC